MDSQEFRASILSKRPRYAKSRIPVIEALANKGNKKSEYNQFGPIYELYIYAFTLGLKKKLKLPLPPRNLTVEFLEIGKWKRDSKLVDFLLMVIFTYSEEIGFDWNELEDMEKKELNDVISNTVEFIESYANGGLEYLQNEWEQDSLINSHYMFVDLMAESSTFKNYEQPEETYLNVAESNENLVQDSKSQIQSGESSKVEFKSTLRVNSHTNKPDPKMELSCLKTIAGFINTNGGVLYVGVSDNKEILGLDVDFNSFGNKSDLLDEFQKHLDNLIEKYLGNSVYSLLSISFPEIDNKMICRIDVDFKKNGPILLKNKDKGNIEEFYIRRAASTIAMRSSEMITYIENHWS